MKFWTRYVTHSELSGKIIVSILLRSFLFEISISSTIIYFRFYWSELWNVQQKKLFRFVYLYRIIGPGKLIWSWYKWCIDTSEDPPICVGYQNNIAAVPLSPTHKSQQEEFLFIAGFELSQPTSPGYKLEKRIRERKKWIIWRGPAE